MIMCSTCGCKGAEEKMDNSVFNASSESEVPPVMDGLKSLEEEQMEVTTNLAEEGNEITSELKESENEFISSMQKFQAEQQEIILQAQNMLPSKCGKCETYLHSKKDKGCAMKNGSCFKCYSAEESQKTFMAEGSIKNQEYEIIATMDLSDYEEWLFDDELGRRTLARIIAKMKAQGYDYKAWQVSIAASAWSKDNYNNTSLTDTRYLVERVKPNELNQYIPENPDGIVSVIDSIKRAEEIRGIRSPTKDTKHWAVIGGIAGLSVVIPYLIKRK